MFNFHRFDNMRYSEKKMDPRQYRIERKGLSTTTLLFAANAGDLTAIKRFNLWLQEAKESRQQLNVYTCACLK